MEISSPLFKVVKGFWLPFNSFFFVKRHPRLYPLIVLPMLINIFSFCLVIYFGFDFYRNLVMSHLPQGDAWYWLILNYFLVLVGIVVVLVMVFFTFAVVGSLLASPFNDVLSEKTELLLGGQISEVPFSFTGFLRSAGQSMLTEVKKISLFLVGMAGLLFLNLVPLVGTLLYPILSIAWTAFFLVIEYTGYVFSRRGLSFAAQRRIVFANAALMTGFGLGLFCLLAIPFLQFFCIPLGVVGAVRLLGEAEVLGLAGEGERSQPAVLSPN